MLLKRFEISTNLSLDGMKVIHVNCCEVIPTAQCGNVSLLYFFQEFLHSGNITEAGPKDLIDDNDDANNDDQSISLPGVLKGE